MPIGENIKRNIRDLYFDQHKTMRELAKITRKSSRDIIAELKVSETRKTQRKIRIFMGIIIFQHQNKKKETHNMTRLQGKVSCRVW